MVGAWGFLCRVARVSACTVNGRALAPLLVTPGSSRFVHAGQHHDVRTTGERCVGLSEPS